VIRFGRAVLLPAMMSLAAVASEAQQQSSAERAYFRAVAHYFQMPEAEVAILGNWDLPPDEISVVLFVARRAGVSAEALVALRGSGRSWTELVARYQIGASALHVPLQDPGSAGRLTELYDAFGNTPIARWGDIRPSSEDIVALINVRVLSQSLGLPPDDIMVHTSTAVSFVELYAQLIR
jgi:hypothetical protein